MDMKELIVLVRVVELLAKNLHYCSGGESFYGLHLLADKVEFEEDIDSLKEAYYLGSIEQLPPCEVEIAGLVAEKIKGFVSEELSNEALVSSLMESSGQAIYTIEQIKSDTTMFAGIHAVLDGISQKLLVIKGLCWRTLNGGSSSEN